MNRVPTEDFEPYAEADAEALAEYQGLRITRTPDSDEGLNEFAPSHYKALGFELDEPAEIQELDFDSDSQFDRWGIPPQEEDYAQE